MFPHRILSPDDPGGGKINLAALDMELDGPYSTPSSPAHKVRTLLYAI